ncbi:MAG: hypothetical protein BWK80_22795, partial [Desulfobacteraceae bacterium IS3]
ATKTGNSKWISNEESRKFVHQLRHASDAIMIGIGTINVDNPMLTTRLEGMSGKDPKRIILDSRLSISEDATVLNLKSASETIVVSGQEPISCCGLKIKAQRSFNCRSKTGGLI